MLLPGKTAARAPSPRPSIVLQLDARRSGSARGRGGRPGGSRPSRGTSFALTDTPFSATPEVSLYAHTARIVSPVDLAALHVDGTDVLAEELLRIGGGEERAPGERAEVDVADDRVERARRARPMPHGGRRAPEARGRGRRRRAAVVTAGRERERRRRHEGEQRQARRLFDMGFEATGARGAEQSPRR